MEVSIQIEKGDFLWLDNKNYSGDGVAIGARVLTVFCDNRMPAEEKRILLLDDDGRKIDASVAALLRTFNARRMHPTSIQMVEDLLQVDEPHEASIMRNLHIRHGEGILYTFIGPRILLALGRNGTKMGMTFDHYNALYSAHSPLELPPHIFSLGTELREKMGKNCWPDENSLPRNCCVLFSGECGSGKSANLRHLLNFLGANTAGPIIKEQLKAIALIMEVFGNAKTASNVNGTRIGHSWQLHFSRQNERAKLNAVNLEHFFVEKGRILDAPIWPENQRNFHIFYSLIAGLSPKQKLEFGIGGDQPSNYHFLDRNKTPNANALPVGLDGICSALRTILFREAEIDSILRILSAILHLGNLRFEMVPTTDDDGSDRVQLNDRKSIGRICKTLKLDESLFTAALTTKVTVLNNGEQFTIPICEVREALDTRDCIVRECYAKLVDQIVAKANETMGGGRRKDCNPSGSICLVDFPGIEANFDVENNFEQLCINYTAECLHQFFIRRIFKLEQSEYEAQCLPGWPLKSIEFTDNWPLLDILAVNSKSIMSTIDDASCAPNPTDDGKLLEQLHNAQQQRDGQQQQRFIVCPKSRLCAQFVVCHYTGQVTYQTKEMLTRNRNQFPRQLRLLLMGSKLGFLRRLFELSAQNGDEDEWMTENKETTAHLKQQTLANCCRKKMNALMGQLSECAEEDTYFVRCIRPNDSLGEEQQVANGQHFDRAVVLRQMRQMDLLAIVEQCRAGFSAKFDYAQFVSRYRILMPNSPISVQECHLVQKARAICQYIFEAHEKSGAAFGKTKIFLKAEGHLLLEQLRDQRLYRCAVLVQKLLRGWAKLRQFERLRWAAIVFQKNWRAFAQQKNYRTIVRGFIRLQSMIRANHCVRHFRQLHANIVQLQAHCRAALLRTQLYSEKTIEDRRFAMLLRLEEDKKLANEPPALFLHAAEFEAGRECVKNLSGGICVRFDGQKEMATQLDEQKLVNGADGANFGWRKFELAFFRNLPMPRHNCRQPIQRALLAQKCQMDEICAMAIWHRVQELMGNALYEQRKIGPVGNEQKPIMLRLSSMFAKHWTANAVEKLRNAILHCANGIPQDTEAHSSSPTLNENVLLCCSENESALDKIQLIVGIGILRAQLRDEIFCQICTQIEHNPSDRSTARGWILLALCSASFSPNAQLLPYFLNFVHRFAPSRQMFCRIERSLMRTRKFGTRKEPPIEAELFCSIFDDARLSVPIHLTDGRLIPLPIDSQSNASELCTMLCNQIGLDDPFGFGLFLTVGHHFVRPLGIGAEFIIDAIGSLENKNEKNWQIKFRKEFFRPRQIESDDPLAIDLAYRQIVRGIHTREYPCEKAEENDLVTVMAQQHFVDIQGQSGFDVKLLEERLDEMLPFGTLDGKENDAEENSEIERQRWVQLIMHAFRKKVVKHCGTVPTVQSVQCQVIGFARIRWPAQFSRVFHLTKFSGPPLPCNRISLTVNSNGLTIFDLPRHNRMAQFSFAQISTAAQSNSKKTAGVQSVSINLLNGDSFTFQSPHSAELGLLISQILHELRHKSLYAIALQNSPAKNEFAYSKGDLLILNVPFGEQNVANNRRITVENAHSGMHGTVALSAVHVFATEEMPTTDELRTFLTPPTHKDAEEVCCWTTEAPVENGIVPFQSAALTTLTDQRSSTAFWAFQFDYGQMAAFHRPHNLERFAADNFRRAEAVHAFSGRSEDSSLYSFSSSSATDDHFDLWRHSKRPLKAPLLKRLNSGGRDEIVRQSICAYSHILMYMYDQQQMFPPAQHHPIGFNGSLVHTDAIFEPPLKHEILRDETYCQLMKQLTLNPNPLSEERGWELMWLCLGLFGPSAGLLPELALFLRSRPFPPLAVDCAARLEKIIINNSRPLSFRQFPPHQVEVEAVQQRQTQIFHKVHLPNGSHVNVEVESWSMAKELCEDIALTLDFHSAFGLFLFVKIEEKVVCVPPDDHFFDFVHQLQRWARKGWAKQNGGTEQTVQFAYKVHFMRKVWLDVVPGQDACQDLILHYYQELPKYLRGFYNIGNKETAQIGALILRAQTKDGKEPPLAHIHHILQQLIPKDQMKMHSSTEWKRQISVEFGANLQMPKSSANAKIAFLRRLSLEPIFGSAFFEVKQSADPKIGSKLLLAINRDGISLYGLEFKLHICTYGFEQISHWQPANTYFHITMEKGNRLLFETTLGHKMDDLLTTYIRALIARRETASAVGVGCQSVNVKSLKENGGVYNKPLVSIGDHRREVA